MVVQQSYRLLDDALEQGVVSSIGDGGVKGHVFVGGEHVACGGYEYRQTVKIFQGGSAGGEAGRLDLHRAAHLHELDDALGPLAEQGSHRLGEARRGQIGDSGALCAAAGHQQAVRLELPQGLADRRAAHSQSEGQLALGGDAVTGLVVTRGDQTAQLLRHLVRDRLWGHRAQPVRGGYQRFFSVVAPILVVHR
jgi:hypothetical protein